MSTRARKGQGQTVSSLAAPTIQTKQNVKARRRGVSVVEDIATDSKDAQFNNEDDPSAAKKPKTDSPQKHVLSRQGRVFGLERTDTPEKVGEEQEPKSTPSNSRPPSSLRIDTTQPNTLAPTPPPHNIQRTVSFDSPDLTPESSARVMKSPLDDEIKRSIAKPPKKRKAIDDIENDVSTGFCTEDKRFAIDWTQWHNQRVLAKKDFTFQSGKIKNIIQNRSIGVLFDGESECSYFTNIFDSRQCNIIGDNPPPTMMISVGCQVCVRITPEHNIFYEGRVVGKQVQPILYQVRLSNQAHIEKYGHDVWRPRAAIRLLQPPWHEDLEDGIPENPSPQPATPTLQSPYPYPHTQQVLPLSQPQLQHHPQPHTGSVAGGVMSHQAAMPGSGLGQPPALHYMDMRHSPRFSNHSPSTNQNVSLDRESTDDEMDNDVYFDSSGLSTPRSGSATPGSRSVQSVGDGKNRHPLKSVTTLVVEVCNPVNPVGQVPRVPRQQTKNTRKGM